MSNMLDVLNTIVVNLRNGQLTAWDVVYAMRVNTPDAPTLLQIVANCSNAGALAAINSGRTALDINFFVTEAIDLLREAGVYEAHIVSY